MENIITLISDVSLTLTLIVAIIFGLREARSSERDRRERFALDYLANFQSREFAELLRYITSKSMPASLKDVRALPENEQIIFIQLSQQMESLGLMVSGDYISLDLVEKTLGSYVAIAWKRYEKLFTIIRENDPYQGEYFQWLADQLEKKQRENPREPFYVNGTRS
jgi:hypothetical protein